MKTGNLVFAFTGLRSDMELILLPWQFALCCCPLLQSFISSLEHSICSSSAVAVGVCMLGEQFVRVRRTVTSRASAGDGKPVAPKLVQ